MAKVFCPACNQLLDHDRGYLPTHMTENARGALVMGSKVCDLSNAKIVTELAEVEYSFECEHCGCQTSMKLTEDYPGAMEQRKAFIEMDCIGCSIDHDGHYCENGGCGIEVKWKDAFWLVSYPHDEEVGQFDTEAKAEAAKLNWMVANPIPAGPPLVTNTPMVPAGGLQLGNLGALLSSMGDEPVVQAMDAGWYDSNGSTYCENDDPFSTDEHQGVFKAEFHRTVLVTDGHVIDEEPDEEREAVNG